MAKKLTLENCATALFWAGMLCELIVSPSGYLFGGYHEPMIIILGMACFSLSILLKILQDPKRLKHDLPLYFLAGGYGLTCYFAQHSALILRIVLILLAGRGQKAKDVVQLFFFGTLAIMVFGAVLAFMGVHNAVSVTQAFRHEEETRYTFGFFHPNGFSFFLFRLYLMGVYLYGEKTKLRYLLPVIAGAGTLLFMANSKTGILLFVLITIGLFLSRYVKSGKYDRFLFISGIASVILIAATLIALRFWPFPEINYGQELTYWDRINEFCSGRADHARIALLETPAALFGSRNVPDGTEVGFVNAYLNQGILFLLLFFVLFVLLYHRLYKEKDRPGMLLAIGFLLYSISEAFLPYFNKNGFWMLMIGMNLFQKNEQTPKSEFLDKKQL